MEPNPPPRRRRRAARRPAGPPADAMPADVMPADVMPADVMPADVIRPPTGESAPPASPPDPANHPAPTVHPTVQPAGPSPAPAGSPGGHPPRPPVERRTTAADAGRRSRPAGSDSAERSLRSLVTTRTTQVSPTAAMRAREVALPDAADLAAAEAELVIVRRHYVPPTSLTAGRRPDRRGTQGRPGSTAD